MDHSRRAGLEYDRYRITSDWRGKARELLVTCLPSSYNRRLWDHDDVYAYKVSFTLRHGNSCWIQFVTLSP